MWRQRPVAQGRSLEQLTPERLSSFVDAAEAELTVAGERSEHIVSIFRGEGGNTVLRLVHGDDVVTHSP